VIADELLYLIEAGANIGRLLLHLRLDPFIEKKHCPRHAGPQ
jgi:hypothetical protein